MTVSEFIKIDPSEIPENLINVIKSKDSLLGCKAKTITELPWGKVQEIKEAYQEADLIKAILIVFTDTKKVTQSKILKEDYREFLYFCRWLNTEMDKVGVMESRLEKEPTDDMIEAGIESLSKFGFINSLDSLAGGDITKWQEVYDMPYKDVYMKLLKDKETSDIQERLQDILRRKAKQR